MSKLSVDQSIALKKFLTGKMRQEVPTPDGKGTCTIVAVNRLGYVYRKAEGGLQAVDYSDITTDKLNNICKS
jgi:hypothetical protein